MWLRVSLAALLLPPAAFAQSKHGADGWRDVAIKHLKPAQVAVLARQDFVVGDDSYRQVFQPYLGADLPVFVTSDSLLNAFHVVLEGSIYRLERVNAARLPAFLEYAVGRLDKAADGLEAEPALVAAAKKRATVFLGTAVRLHNQNAGTFDRPTAELIRAEVARVAAARERSKPAWLGPPDRGFVAIDYSRFRPRGFYTRRAELERYFRVVSWLQAIPFRVEKDEELLAALILSRAAVVPREPKFAAAQRGREVLDSFGEFLGSGDDWGLGVLEWYHDRVSQRPDGEGKSASMLDRLRAELLERAKDDRRPRINDQLAFIPDEPGAVAEVSIRVATPYRLPDAVLFQRTTDPRRLKRAWPSGLDVAAALGSAYARRQLAKSGGQELLALIDADKELVVGRRGRADEDEDRRDEASSIYAQYLDCLASLAGTTEPDWPAFMKAEPWQAKTCQAALAGWAQMRHTWVLQAKLDISYLGRGPKAAGFVEPVPEFYRKFGRLCHRVTTALDRAGAFTDDWRGLARDARDDLDRQFRTYEFLRIEKSIGILTKARVATRGAAAFKQLSGDDRETVRSVVKDLGRPDPAKLERPEQFQACLDHLQKERARKARKLDEADVVLEWRWRRLRECCERLECLGHKQLRGREFAAPEKAFLRGYGESLAWLMFYEKEASHDPRDDAPRIVDVFANGGNVLEVGIGRPRVIYVLYPWQGKDILCRGAVLPYHEFTHRERLTDEAWRALLASPSRPVQPAWTAVLTDGVRR